MSYLSEVLADAPLAYYRLGEASGTTMVDSSGNSRDGTYVIVPTLGVAGLLSGDSDTAASWNGTTDSRGEVASATWMDTSAFTLEALIKPSSAGGTRVIMSRASAAGSPFSFRLDGGKLALHSKDASDVWQVLTYSTALTMGTTYHVAATRTSSGDVTIYVDGSAVATATFPTIQPSTSKFFVGSSQAGERFAGVIDEAAFYGTALPADRIAAHYVAAGGTPTLPSATAALSGAGALAATAVAVRAAVAAASGAGALTATAEQVGGPVTTAAALSGAGILSATAAAFVPPVEVDTETGNMVGGRSRAGYGVASWEPPVVVLPRVPGGPIKEIAAVAFGAPTFAGTEVFYSRSQATAPRAQHRILMGGQDVTAFRGVITPPASYQLAEPLLYGPAKIQFPQVHASFEEPGVGALRFMRKHAPVIVQRVVDGVVVGEDYRGVVLAYDTSGATFAVECGGEAQGRSQARDKQLPIFRDVLDLGRLWWRAISELGLRFEPRLGPATGIPVGTFGGMGHLDYIAALSALGWTRAGNQWTCMPDDEGVYRLQRKDTTTVHFTLFADDATTVANLRRDTLAEPNRVFVSGVTPNGQRVRNGVYPGLRQSKPAPYPFNDNRAFGDGTTNEDTDTGDGISRLIGQLRGRGYLSMEDVPGGYDQDVHDAVFDLQDDAGFFEDGFGSTPPGWVDPATWRALYDLDVTGYDLNDAHIEPMAQRPATRRYWRSPAGSIMRVNPKYDAHVLPVDETLQMDDLKRQQMREYARAELVREENWIGTIKITTGAVLAGDVAVGSLVTPAELMDARSIRPGMNARLPLFAGGILVHVSGVEVSADEVTLTVDTQARDATKVWEIIKRNRETRRDPARRWRGNRASTEIKDAVDVWDEIGGVLDGDVDLEPGWNVIPVVAGQEGTVSRLRLLVQDVTVDGGVVAVQGREFACAVFGRPITAERLKHLVGNPLAASPEATAEPDPAEKDAPETDPEVDDETDPSTSTPAVKPWWEKRGVAAKLRERDMLYSAGTREEPCGYSPGKKAKGATRTGLHRDDAGFSYRTGPQPVLYLAVWVWGPRTLSGGRVMWNQLEAGA